MQTSVTFNEKNGNFIIRSNDKARMQENGLDWSMPATDRMLTREERKDGFRIYFTDEPYAALYLWHDCDTAAQRVLAELRRQYLDSFAIGLANAPSIPRPRGKEYLPYQSAGVHLAAERGNCLIGDEPGLGKTIQALGLANLVRAQRVLVICPATLRLTPWRREILAWSTIKRPRIYPIMKSSNGVNPHANFTIVSYDLIRNPALHRALMAQQYDLLVLDEAHYLKSPEAKRTRAVFGWRNNSEHVAGLADRASRILALTGTPLPNRPKECYTLTRGLCFDAIDYASEDGFATRFNPVRTIRSRKGTVVASDERTGRLEELQARLRCNFMIRRLKDEVLKDLPAKRYELSYVDDSAEIARALRKEKMLHLNLDDLVNPDPELFGEISTIRREMGEAKAPRAADYIDMLVDGGLNKVLVGVHHKSVMKILAERLAKHGVVAINGDTPQGRRPDIVDQFQKDPGTKIFLGQLLSAGTGITLTAASHVVFVEASWVPGENEQFVDRTHRIGQHNPVLAQFLVVAGSFDEKILGNNIEKYHTIHAALDKRS